ncbi:ankyrin repeat-containing domain protein [Cercophora newfieldiana]|uniref:Ankyrin repeat-containing domain protein n=1 Tax=Cercophora newfieldiana TaxID=92897 RepID=A0AA39XUV0_9PEZI|nr:ankyrin repeat-containing domain protein [Cercophora newfieldiana]
MPRRRGQATPSGADWSRHKNLIRKRYIIDGLSTAHLSSELGESGFAVTPKQLEHQLVKWGFRRNVTETGWKYIDNKLAEREAGGKDSLVLLCGRALGSNTVKKERSRHQSLSLRTRNEPPPSTPPDFALSICTPPAMPLEFAWPQNLPWLSFRRKFPTGLISGFPLNSGSHSLALDRDDLRSISQTAITTILKDYFNTSIQQAGLSIARLASCLGREMPESYSGEHLTHAEILRGGTVHEVYQVFATLLVFRISNSICWYDDIVEWEFLMDLIQWSQLLERPLNLSSLTEPTISAFFEQLFKQAISAIVGSRNPKVEGALRGKTWAVIDWLVRSGINFNRVPLRYNGSRALGLALEYREFKLAALLLGAGADLNPTGCTPPLQRFIENLEGHLDSSNRKSVLELIQSMLDSGARLNNSVLIMAITIGDTKLIDLLVRNGANILASKRENHVFQDEHSALSRCAGYMRRDGRHLVPDEATALCLLSQMLDSLEQQFPDLPIMGRITASVVMAAAMRGYSTVMRLLRERIASVNVRTASGATPLHAAAFHGHLELCELLLSWGHSADEASLAGLSPLHLACFCCNPAIARLLVRHGADLERVCTIRKPKRGSLSDINVGTLRQRLRPGRLITPLKLAVHQSEECAMDLLTAGAQPLRDALLIGVHWQQCDGQLFDLLLARGADPNASHPINGTVLQRALKQGLYGMRNNIMPLKEVERRVYALLERGAKVAGGEIVQAVKLGSFDLIMRLAASGALCSDTGCYGERVMEVALQNDNPDLPEVLYALASDYDAGALCSATRAALISHKGNRHWVATILRHRPSGIDSTPMEGTALSLAIRHRDYGLMDLLLGSIPAPHLAILPFCLQDPFRGWDLLGKDAPLHTSQSLGPHRSLAFWADESVDQWWQKGALPPRRWHKRSYFWRTERNCCRGSPITIAVAIGDLELAQWLLGRGVAVDRLALAMAVARGSLPLVELLVSALKHVPEQLEQLGTAPIRQEENPLCWAICRRDISMFRLLQSIGVDIRSVPYRESLWSRSNLQQAVELGASEIVKLLIDAGADINEPPADHGGATSLQLAAIMGYLGIAKHLLDLGADVNAAGSDRRGRTALEGAAENGRIDIIQLLLDHGAETAGRGQRQYLRAIRFATQEGYLVAADLLRAHRVWTEEDETVYAEVWREDERSPAIFVRDVGSDTEREIDIDWESD